MVLSDLLHDILGRVEESGPADPSVGGNLGPVFWNLSGEVYVQMVYALFETAIITGNVQVNDWSLTLDPGTTYFAVQNSFKLPRGLIAPIRMRVNGVPVKKTTLKALDDLNPGWQQESPGSSVISWFPLGVSAFGIYPQLQIPLGVMMDFIASPITTSRPYTGYETIPYQTEFTDILCKYSAMLLRSKEGGAEADEGDAVFKDYLSEMRNLSLFQQRIDSLVASLALGFRSGVNPRTVV